MRWVRLAGAVASLGLGIWAPPVTWRHTLQPIAEIVRFFVRTFPAPRPLFAMQMYGKLKPASLTEVESPPAPVGAARLRCPQHRGKNHGLLLGTKDC
jgi:hypothetical protein